MPEFVSFGQGKMGLGQGEQHCILCVHISDCLYSTLQLLGANLASVEVLFFSRKKHSTLGIEQQTLPGNFFLLMNQAQSIALGHRPVECHTYKWAFVVPWVRIPGNLELNAILTYNS